MSVILALESGGEYFSAALNFDGDIRLKFGRRRAHSDIALPLVQRLLADAQISLSRCDAFAFGEGPGKFSGLRLSCGIAQSLAYAHDRPAIAVSSLAALAAANFPHPPVRLVKAAFAAHRGHLYFALCDKKGDLWRARRPRLIAVNGEIPARHCRHACGDGFAAHPTLLGKAVLETRKKVPNAEAVADLARLMFARNATTTALDCAPCYVRRKIALTIAERRGG